MHIAFWKENSNFMNKKSLIFTFSIQIITIFAKVMDAYTLL